jgi:hypothetical protein
MTTRSLVVGDSAIARWINVHLILNLVVHVVTFTFVLCLLGNPSALGQYENQGHDEGVDWELKHTVFKELDENGDPIPLNSNTFLPGQTVTSRQEASIENVSGSTGRTVILRCALYKLDPVTNQMVYVNKLEFEQGIKPGEPQVKFSFHYVYTAPAMPDTPERVEFKVRLVRQLPVPPNGYNENVWDGNDVQLQRHH